MFLHNVEFRHLKALVEFMYVGEVNVAQTQLPAFLRTAESLQIRGLADNHAKVYNFCFLFFMIFFYICL